MDNSNELTTASIISLSEIFPNVNCVNFENSESKFESQVCKQDQERSMGSICTNIDKVDDQESDIQVQENLQTEEEAPGQHLIQNVSKETVDIGEDAAAFQSSISHYNETAYCDDSETHEQEKQEIKRKADEEKRIFIMGKFLDTAIDNRWNTMIIHIKNWMNYQMTWDNYHRSIYHLNKNICWNELDTIKQVPRGLLQDFSIELDNRSKIKYRNYAKEIVDTIKKFESQISVYFSNTGYLDEQTITDIMINDYDRITNAVQDNSIRGIFQHVRNRFLDILKDYNSKVLHNEVILQEDVMEKMVIFYNENMKKFVNNGPHSMHVLLSMHTQLVTELTNVYIKAMAVSPGNPHKDIIEKCDQLMVSMETNFSSYEASNLNKINQLHVKAKEIISSCQERYTKSINEIACKDANGINELILKNQHIRIKEMVGEVLESEIRSKIGTSEPLTGYKTELEYLMNSYFEKILNYNQKNYSERVFLSNEPTTSSTSTSNTSSCPSPTKNNEPYETLVIDFKNCTHLLMSVKHKNQNLILLNEFNESETPAIVGYSYVTVRFSYGNQVTCLMTRWNLANQLDTDYKESSHATVQGVYRTISFEFLLAFLLRKLKVAAEAQIGTIFSSALIIIPFWFSSSHRVKMLNGAKLSGFSEVYLVNEPSCLAFSCIPNTTDGKLLVITGNRNGVRAFYYNCSKSESKVRLVNYWKILEIKYGNGVLDILSGKDKVTKLLSKDYKKVKKSIKQDLDKVLEEIKIGTCPLTVYISESEEWKGMLYKVAQRFTHRHIIDYKNAVFDGALDLSNNPKNICDSIADFLSYEVFVKDLVARNKGVEKVAGLKTPLSSEKELITTTGWIELLQKHELDEELRRIELLEIQTGWSNQLVKITMEISRDGIFTCERVDPYNDSGDSRAAAVSSRGQSSFLKRGPNLSEKEYVGLVSWLDQLLPLVSPQKFEINKAKKYLLQLCVEISKKIDSSMIYFESELSKMEVLDQISEGKEFAEHPNVSLDDLKEQTEILQKLYEYCTQKSSNP